MGGCKGKRKSLPMGVEKCIYLHENASFCSGWHKPCFWHKSDSVKRHLSRRHLSVLNLKFDFISDGGCTREEQIALSPKRHLFPHGGREPKGFWICFPRVHPPSEIKSNFKFKTLKRHLLKRHLTLSEQTVFLSRAENQQVRNVGAQTWGLETRRKAAGKRHFPATQLFRCCSAVFRLLQRSFWSK